MTHAVHLVAVFALAAIWLAAGVLADGLADAVTARALRRRTNVVAGLTATGLLLLTALALLAPPAGSTSGVDIGLMVLLLGTLPALVGGTVAIRRLARLHSGATAFIAAPDTPTPPALRAASAHPLLVTPLQTAGLTSVVACALVAGLLRPSDPGMVGVIVTGLSLAILVLVVRHALRHNRLAESAVTVRRTLARSA